MFAFGIPALLGLVIIALIRSAIRVCREWERAVVLRFGKYQAVRGPGLILLIPVVEHMVRVDLREVVLDIKTQEAITRDNVTLKVNAVLIFRVTDPKLAILRVEHFDLAVTQFAQTSLRSIIGQFELDELLAHRDQINSRLQTIVDAETERWGVKVTAMEIKDVELPPSMQRAMARQAEAEREKRAKIIHAEGEFQAAQRLAEAARAMSAEPAAIQLRYLQTLTEIAVEKSSTILFPVPVDTLKSFLQDGRTQERARAVRAG